MESALAGPDLSKILLGASTRRGLTKVIDRSQERAARRRAGRRWCEQVRDARNLAAQRFVVARGWQSLRSRVIQRECQPSALAPVEVHVNSYSLTHLSDGTLLQD